MNLKQKGYIESFYQAHALQYLIIDFNVILYLKTLCYDGIHWINYSH